MKRFVWFTNNEMKRIAKENNVGLFPIDKNVAQLSEWTQLTFKPYGLNPYEHPHLLFVSRNSKHALGTVSWEQLFYQHWKLTVNQLVHAWPATQPLVSNQEGTYDTPQLMQLMLGTQFQQTQMGQDTFLLSQSMQQLTYMVKHMYDPVDVLCRDYPTLHIPWVALWMITDRVGNKQLIQKSTEWERTHFMQCLTNLLEQYGEGGMSQLFAYNQLDESCVVDVTHLDLRWFYNMYQYRYAPPVCMFKVPLDMVDDVDHAPYRTKDGPYVRISYRQLPHWLWECQTMLRRQWHTNMYRNFSKQNPEPLPEQIQLLVHYTQSELVKYVRPYTCRSQSTDMKPVSMDIEDCIEHAPPCIRRALQQMEWVPEPSMPDQLEVPSKQYWLKNDARNQIIYAASEANYPVELIELLMLHVRQRAPEGSASNTVHDVRRLVNVKSEMKYASMNCEQLRRAHIPGLSCVWKTKRDDLAKFMCHCQFIMEHGNVRTSQQHLEDRFHFKKPSFYWTTRNRVTVNKSPSE